MGHTTPTHCSRFKWTHKPDIWQYYAWCQRDKQDCRRMKCKSDIPCPHIRRPVAQSGQEFRIAREGRKAKWDAIFTETTILLSGIKPQDWWSCKNGKQNRCTGTDIGINKPVKTKTIWAKCGINNWVANTHVVTFEQLVLEVLVNPSNLRSETLLQRLLDNDKTHKETDNSLVPRKKGFTSPWLVSFLHTLQRVCTGKLTNINACIMKQQPKKEKKQNKTKFHQCKGQDLVPLFPSCSHGFLPHQVPKLFPNTLPIAPQIICTRYNWTLNPPNVLTMKSEFLSSGIAIAHVCWIINYFWRFHFEKLQYFPIL